MFSLKPLRLLSMALALALSACGGGGGSDADGPASCSVADQKDWLRSYMSDWYYWYQLSPNPSLAGYSTVDSYFDDLLYGGGGLIPGSTARWPRDRYSYSQSTESFNRFFGDGQTLGYGVSVNGLEAVSAGATRLFVRYVEPASPAARSGLVRGDEVLTINSESAASVIARNDFSALTAGAAGDLLRLSVRRSSGATVSVALNAEVFALTPVQNGQRFVTVGGRLLGYVFVKDMISQVASPLNTVMADFRARGVNDLVLDLRYNGGGLVSMGGTVASYVSGSSGTGQRFARLLYNDRQSAYNQDFLFSNPGNWAGFNRVYVLVGERTCSASEQVINGLRGIGVNVIAIGDTTCGKPVGFLARDDSCGTTYSVVNFESVNARNEGRYFDGFQPTCLVAEDFSLPIADSADPLLTAAAYHADAGACPAGTAFRELAQSRSLKPRIRYDGGDGGERTGMSGR